MAGAGRGRFAYRVGLLTGWGLGDQVTPLMARQAATAAICTVVHGPASDLALERSGFGAARQGNLLGLPHVCESHNGSSNTCMFTCCLLRAAADADVHLADPNTGNAAQMAAAVGHMEIVEKLVEAGCAWPHGKKANSGLGAPVDVVQLLAQKTGTPVSNVREK